MQLKSVTLKIYSTMLNCTNAPTTQTPFDCPGDDRANRHLRYRPHPYAVRATANTRTHPQLYIVLGIHANHMINNTATDENLLLAWSIPISLRMDRFKRNDCTSCNKTPKPSCITVHSDICVDYLLNLICASAKFLPCLLKHYPVLRNTERYPTTLRFKQNDVRTSDLTRRVLNGCTISNDTRMYLTQRKCTSCIRPNKYHWYQLGKLYRRWLPTYC